MADNRRESLRAAQARYNARVALERWLERYQAQLGPGPGEETALAMVAKAIEVLSPLGKDTVGVKSGVARSQSDTKVIN